MKFPNTPILLVKDGQEVDFVSIHWRDDINGVRPAAVISPIIHHDTHDHDAETISDQVCDEIAKHGYMDSADLEFEDFLSRRIETMATIKRTIGERLSGLPVWQKKSCKVHTRRVRFFPSRNDYEIVSECTI